MSAITLLCHKKRKKEFITGRMSYGLLGTSLCFKLAFPMDGEFK